MDRTVVEQGLVESTAQIRRACDELAYYDEVFERLRAELEDSRLRAIASETPNADELVFEARHRVEAVIAARSALSASIHELREAQDRLLGQLSKSSKTRQPEESPK
jgi:hypothetical protein